MFKSSKKHIENKVGLQNHETKTYPREVLTLLNTIYILTYGIRTLYYIVEEHFQSANQSPVLKTSFFKFITFE